MNDNLLQSFYDVPGGIWLYGLLRVGSLGLPIATGTGGIGLGLVVIPPLFVMLVRRSASAWGTLLVFDSVSFGILGATRAITDAAPLQFALAAVALLLLLLPSVRRWVTVDRPGDADTT